LVRSHWPVHISPDPAVAVVIVVVVAAAVGVVAVDDDDVVVAVAAIIVAVSFPSPPAVLALLPVHERERIEALVEPISPECGAALDVPGPGPELREPERGGDARRVRGVRRVHLVGIDEHGGSAQLVGCQDAVQGLPGLAHPRNVGRIDDENERVRALEVVAVAGSYIAINRAKVRTDGRIRGLVCVRMIARDSKQEGYFHSTTGSVAQPSESPIPTSATTTTTTTTTVTTPSPTATATATHRHRGRILSWPPTSQTFIVTLLY
jgi:hypothetical protein